MLRKGTLTALAVVLASTITQVGVAAPTLKKTLDVRGDVVVIGNTMGWDCGAGVTAPAGTTVSCTGVLESDTAADAYWRDNDASPTRFATDARTSATLTLPAGATVAHARLYWSAILAGTALADPTPDANVTFDREGGFSAVVTADASTTLATTGPVPTLKYVVYQSTADVTSLVQTNGAGGYRVSDLDSIVLNGVASENAYSAWTLVVVFSDATAPYHHVQLFDGLGFVDSSGAASVTTNGFRIPVGGAVTGRVAAWVYDGDATETGDHFSFKGTNLSDASNPAANFWNSSRTFLGSPVSGLVPNLSGAPNVMAQFDLDLADVSALMTGGDTSATVAASTTGDSFWIGGIATSIQSAAPNLAVTKTFTDLNGGAIIPGDVLEFTITATNTGDDDAVSTVLTDVLPAGLDFVPGSLSIATGAGAGAKTDATGDDQGELVAATRTVTMRVGTGATASVGGTLAPSASTSVKFRVTISGTPRSAANQVTVTAAGALGAPPTAFLSDGDSVTIGAQATTFTVSECDASGGCIAPKVCDLPTNTCVTPGVDAGADTGAGDAAADGALDASGDASADASGDASADAAGDASADASGDASGDASAGDGDTGGAGDTAVGDGSGGDAAGDGSTSADGGRDARADATSDDATSGQDASELPTDDQYVAQGSGCACSTPRSSTNDARDDVLALAGLAAVIAVLRRRR